MEIPLFLQEVVIVLALAVAVVFICHFARLPAIVGFLLTGVLAGPQVLGLIKNLHDVEILAEMGVVFLLFTIGIEFSLRELWKMRFTVFVGGALQFFLTVLAVAAIFSALNFPWQLGILLGCLVACSSTAIVLKLLQERTEMESPHGVNCLSILIFQDIIIVPVMLLLPLLSGHSENVMWMLFVLLGKGIFVIILTFISAIYIVPKLLHQIAKTQNNEIFLLSIVVIAFAVAFFTSHLGLSLGLGAFLAGLIISESRYSYQALSGILPFCHVFISFFFISIGMLLDISYLINNLPLIFACLVLVFVLKTIVTTGAIKLLGYPLRIALLAGLITAQVGEFSFVIAKAAMTEGMEQIAMKAGIPFSDIYQVFLAVAVLSMAYTPFLISSSHTLTNRLLRLLRLEKKASKGRRLPPSITKKHWKNHMLVVGFGLNGRNVTRAAKAENIPYLIVEMNPITVQEELKNGEPIVYGDATNASLLDHVKVKKAKIVVVVISDPVATRKIVSQVRKLAPQVYIIARTRFLSEMKTLYENGANEVIPEEFETSVEIFTRVLRHLLVPEQRIEAFTQQIRSDNYRMFREIHKEATTFHELTLNIPDLEIHTFYIGENSHLIGQTLAELALRKQYGISVIAIQRGDTFITNIDADTKFQKDDRMVVIGNNVQCKKALAMFSHEEQEEK